MVSCTNRLLRPFSIALCNPLGLRVLYGYFENNTLKVVATKAHNFDVPNYAEVMDYLVRWAAPEIHGDTRIGESLSIIEDNEDESLDHPPSR